MYVYNGKYNIELVQIHCIDICITAMYVPYLLPQSLSP